MITKIKISLQIAIRIILILKLELIKKFFRVIVERKLALWIDH